MQGYGIKAWITILKSSIKLAHGDVCALLKLSAFKKRIKTTLSVAPAALS